MRCFEKRLEVFERAVFWKNRVEVGNVIAAIAQRRSVHRQQPETINAEVADVTELFDQAGKITDAVGVGIIKAANIKFVKYCMLVPERIVREGVGFRH